MLNATHAHSLSDFLVNHELHLARLKETRVPETLTINGREEAVLLDAETFHDLIEVIDHEEEVSAIRAIMSKAEEETPLAEAVSDADIARSFAIMRELVAETERLGLYR